MQFTGSMKPGLHSWLIPRTESRGSQIETKREQGGSAEERRLEGGEEPGEGKGGVAKTKLTKCPGRRSVLTGYQ